MINKGMMLKTAAVVSCVVALGITGCQGGNNEAAAVKNKSNIEVSIQNAKGESVDVQRDGKEDIEAVGRCTEPARASAEAGSSDTKPVNGYVGSDRRNGEASSNDNERSEEKGRTDPKADSKAEQPEDEDNNAGEKDRGTDSSSEPLGTGDGFEDDSAVSVSSISDMGRQDEPESDIRDEEYPDNAGLGNEDDNSGFESEQSEYSYDSTDQYEYEDPGTVESGEGSTEGYDESVSELVDSGDASEEAGSDYYGDEEMTFLGTWASTGYCACELCCGQWSSGYTASGTWATEGITCACGMFDFGTVLYIEGFGYRVVEDRGVEGEFVDIFYSSHDAASAHGLQYVNVYLVN